MSGTTWSALFMDVRVGACVFVCVRACMYVCMRACVCACVRVYMYYNYAHSFVIKNVTIEYVPKYI